MTWIKLDDGCPEHLTLIGLTDAAFAAWVRGLCYSSRNLTDGRIPKAALRAIGTPRAAVELVANGKWTETPAGWLIHDYADHQRTSATVEKDREKWRKSKAETRDVHRGQSVDRPRSPRNVRAPEVEVEVETEIDQDLGQLLTLAPLAEHEPGFDAFWSVFPAKKGKPKAREAWAKAVKRADPEAIIAAAAAYRDDPHRDAGHTKWPQGWLNDGRWDDEPTTPTGTKGALAKFDEWAKAHPMTNGHQPAALPERTSL